MADSIIAVTIQPGEKDTGKHFVDGNDGSILSGTVSDDDGKPLAYVIVQLQSPDGTITYTTTQDVEPGGFKVVETSPN